MYNDTLRNIIIDRGEAEADNAISKGDIFTVASSGMLYIYIFLFCYSKLLYLVPLLHKANCTRTFSCAYDIFTIDLGITLRPMGIYSGISNEV